MYTGIIAEKGKWQTARPNREIGTEQQLRERVFECLIESLAGAVALRVERSGAKFADAPRDAERAEDLRLEAAPLISENFVGGAELENPVIEKSARDGRSVLKHERHSYSEFCEKIDDS